MLRNARLLLAVVAALALAGCPRKPPPPGQQRTLVVHAEAEPAHLVTLLQPDAWAHRMTMHHLFEGLVRMDPRSYAMTGELASTWKVSADGLTYDFYLRQGVSWHDGKPFTGEDVKFTLDRVMDERVRATSMRSSLEAYIKSYSLVAPDRLQIVCKARSPFFLISLADLSILPAHLMRQGDLNSHPLLRKPVGTGPYRFESWQAGREVVLARWDGYWGPKPRLERIAYRFVTQPDLALRLARRGELDFLSRLRAQQWEEVKKDPALMHQSVLTRHYLPGSAYIMLNHQRKLFQDVRVRRALARLLDLQTITGKIMGGLATPVGALYWIKDPDYASSISPIAFDPPGARRLLAEAGFKPNERGLLERGGEPLRFTFAFVAGSQSQKQWLTMYQEELRKSGVVMEISPIDWAAYLERIRKHDFDAGALAMQQVSPYTDLHAQFHSSQLEDGQNYGAYKNARVDRLLDQIRSELDPAKRRPLSLEVQKILADEVAVIPLFALEDPGLVARRVHGVYASALWYQLRDWWIE